MQGIRYLHFGTPWIQGAMRLRKPHELVLDYTQDMMAWLMLFGAPSRILQLGLGAGACARFLGHFFPRSGQTVIELKQEVILANSLMFGTRNTRGLTLIQDDAKAYLRASDANHWPLMLVDLYDAEALGPSCEGQGFYRSCYRALQAPGLMVVNLFGSHPSWTPNLKAISDAFKCRPLVLTPGSAGNVVVIVTKGPPLAWPLQRGSAEMKTYLNRRAAILRSGLKLPAQRWIDPIRKYLEP